MTIQIHIPELYEYVPEASHEITDCPKKNPSPSVMIT